MTTFTSGAQTVEVEPENETAFETAGWSRVEDEKPQKKADK